MSQEGQFKLLPVSEHGSITVFVNDRILVKLMRDRSHRLTRINYFNVIFIARNTPSPMSTCNW